MKIWERLVSEKQNETDVDWISEFYESCEKVLKDQVNLLIFLNMKLDLMILNILGHLV